MYNGDIPFHPYTGEPMFYPSNEYEWLYEGEQYRSWFQIEKKFGKDAVKQAERITVGPDWRKNKTFKAVLSIVGMSRGRSAANFEFEDRCNGVKYTMFMSDLLDLLQNSEIKNGRTDYIEWEFCKKGQNFGIKRHV